MGLLHALAIGEDGEDEPAHDLDVFLGHRPRSISRRVLLSMQSAASRPNRLFRFAWKEWCAERAGVESLLDTWFARSSTL
jgi:hypothetical protein